MSKVKVKREGGASRKSCATCRKPFKSKRPWGRFCGDPCRFEWHNTRKVKGERLLADIESGKKSLKAS